METERRCTICFRLLPDQRRARFPYAVTCGKTVCEVANRRRVHSAHALISQRRARAAAQKNKAQRAAQTNGLAAVDTARPKTWPEALERLDRPLTAIEVLNRRE